MAAKLQCEICGGKLIGKPGGIFECDSCGMEYDTAWAKAKIQEITGTVKVEGTVEVQGKVQVEGPVKVEGTANKESLLKRGFMALEDRKWDEARGFFNEALNADAECADAWLGLALAEEELRGENSIAFLASTEAVRRIEGNRSFARFLRFAAPERSGKLTGDLDRARASAAQREEQDRREAEEYAERERREAEECRVRARARIAPVRGVIAAGRNHTVALRADGTVAATQYTGKFYCGQCEVSGWQDIVAVAAAEYHTVGLKSDGTVVATQPVSPSIILSRDVGQSDVSGWRDIVAIAAGRYHTVGLRSDGTVVAAGKNYSGECDVYDMTDVVAVAAGEQHTVALRSDGTVVATKNKDEAKDCKGWSDVSGWTDIVAIAAGKYHTVALRSDGTLAAVGETDNGQCDVSDWEDVVAIAAGEEYTVGLRADGTVVATQYKNKSEMEFYSGQCSFPGWTDIVAIAAGFSHTVGLKSDGTVVAVGSNYDGRCDVSDWKLFGSLDSLGQERREAAERTERERKEATERAKAERLRRIAELSAEQNALQTELPNLKGIFSAKRRKEIEARLAEIEAELKKLS